MTIHDWAIITKYDIEVLNKRFSWQTGWKRLRYVNVKTGVHQNDATHLYKQVSNRFVRDLADEVLEPHLNAAFKLICRCLFIRNNPRKIDASMADFLDLRKDVKFIRN